MTMLTASTAEEWQAASARAVVPLAVQRIRADFCGQLERTVLGDGVAVVLATAGVHVLQRSQRLIDGSASDSVIVQVSRRGPTTVDQFGRTAHLRAESGALYDTRHPYVLGFPAPNSAYLLQISRSRLDLPERTIAATAAREVPGSSPVLGVLRSLVSTTLPAVGELPAEAVSTLGDAAVDLVRVLARSMTGDRPQRPSRLESLLEAMRSTVRDHLDDPELTPADLAARHGTSLRTVYNVFSLIGTTPAEYIRSRRLARGAGLLRATDAVVEDIALACGFSDAGTFARAFRRAHGAGPAAWRAATEHRG